MVPGAPCQEVWNSAATFSGTVLSVTPPRDRQVSFPQRTVRLVIKETFSGLAAEQKEVEVVTGMGGGDCGIPFERGVDYLVYAYKNGDGRLAANICSRTRKLVDAASDLEYLHGLASAPNTADVRIQVIDPTLRRTGKGGLAGVQVTIDGPSGQRTAQTDGSGLVAFLKLPPGQYKVTGTNAGYVIPHAVPVIQVVAKGCADVMMPMELDRKITGQVRNDAGLPASGVVIKVIPRRPKYENELPFATSEATTDVKGYYELKNLETGDYYLGINMDRTPQTSNPYTRWFFPGTEDPSAASLVQVPDRPSVLQFDITLPPKQSERIIRGTVHWPDGKKAEGVQIYLEDPRWPWQNSVVATSTNSAGRFEVKVLDGTRYRLHAVMPARLTNQAVSTEPLTIPPGKEALQLVLLLTRKGHTPSEGVGKGLERWRSGQGLQ